MDCEIRQSQALVELPGVKLLPKDYTKQSLSSSYFLRKVDKRGGEMGDTRRIYGSGGLIEVDRRFSLLISLYTFTK